MQSLAQNTKVSILDLYFYFFVLKKMEIQIENISRLKHVT